VRQIENAFPDRFLKQFALPYCKGCKPRQIKSIVLPRRKNNQTSTGKCVDDVILTIVFPLFNVAAFIGRPHLLSGW
jgi:hypothetical protein